MITSCPSMTVWSPSVAWKYDRITFCKFYTAHITKTYNIADATMFSFICMLYINGKFNPVLFKQLKLIWPFTWKEGGSLNRASVIFRGSEPWEDNPTKSMTSSRGLRYSSSEVMGLLMSMGTPRLPLTSWLGSEGKKHQSQISRNLKCRQDNNRALHFVAPF